MDKELPTSLERDRLLQLSKEQLVDVIMEQALAIQVLKSKIVELEQEIQRLLVSRDLDSQTSSLATIRRHPEKIRKKGLNTSKFIKPREWRR